MYRHSEKVMLQASIAASAACDYMACVMSSTWRCFAAGNLLMGALSRVAQVIEDLKLRG